MARKFHALLNYQSNFIKQNNAMDETLQNFLILYRKIANTE